MSKVYVFLADGFEEVEALTPVDLLRRAGNTVVTVSIMGTALVTGARGITVLADALFEKTDFAKGELFILPGGMPGTTNLEAHEGLKKLLGEKMTEGRHIAAICAAPSVLAKEGILKGKTATAYPGFEKALKQGGAVDRTDLPVITDGNVTTSRGAGTAMDFSLELIRVMNGQEISDKIKDSVIVMH